MTRTERPASGLSQTRALLAMVDQVLATGSLDPSVELAGLAFQAELRGQLVRAGGELLTTETPQVVRQRAAGTEPVVSATAPGW